MHKILNNLILINKELSAINTNAKIIAVSKTFPINHIKPLIDYGHVDYGENKVQEASEKWTEVKEKNNNIKLHLIGKLQTNKVKYCLPLFDYIHSLDSLKLADKIANEQIKKNFKPKIFIQINVGDETQKNGVSINEFDSFYNKIMNDFELDVLGLMCIPPYVQDSKMYFEKMIKLKNKTKLSDLSMGMSNDYLDAAKSSASYLRIGSKIFGQRG